MALHALKTHYMLAEYKILKLLGEGGFGLTYLAFDTHLEKQVAIKEYMPCEHAIRSTDSQVVAKSESSQTVYDWGLHAFLNEAKTVAKFEDINIVRIYRFFEANGSAYIVMEYCDGGCLIDRVTEHIHLQEQQLIPIISSIAHGLQLVHNNGILHRDIKPDNIMFRADGTPVLIDFGAARQALGTKSRKVTTIITPGYAPLEQYSSNGEIGPWSDIYSLSAVAYFCITGTKPPDIMNRLHEDSIEKLSHRDSSSAFLRAIDKGLELQTVDRPQSLFQWSRGWSHLDFTEHDKNQQWQASHIPIYAHKEVSGSGHHSSRPISARSSLDPYEKTVINENSIPQKPQQKGRFLKFMGILILMVAIAVGAYFAYPLFLKQYFQYTQKSTTIVDTAKPAKIQTTQLVNTITPTTTETTQQQAEDLVLQAQQLLKQLNYTVAETGILDARTIENIKSFESTHNMTSTGVVDAVLLRELQTAVKAMVQEADEKAWKTALSEHTISAYETYLITHPTGAYAEQVPILITEIKSIAQKQIELLALQKQEYLQAENLAAQVEQEKINKIKAEQRQLIADIQLRLKQLKFSALNTDGELNTHSKNAIKAYQRLKKIETDAVPSKTLLFLLKAETKWPGRQDGEVFSDCDVCPKMVVIPAGNFIMGSDTGKDNEKPPHHVTLAEFSLGETEITFQHWNACVNDNGCSHKPVEDDLNRDKQAVMLVNKQDIEQYLAWLQTKSSKKYRLPSEAEWEYAARARTTTTYSWGDAIGENNVSCLGCNSGIDNNIINQVKNYSANPFGLYDMHGNVWEWTADCWHPNYLGAPSDNLPWEPNDCKQFVVRGGSGGNPPIDLRSASRGAMQADNRLNSLGFRVALDSD